MRQPALEERFHALTERRILAAMQNETHCIIIVRNSAAITKSFDVDMLNQQAGYIRGNRARN